MQLDFFSSLFKKSLLKTEPKAEKKEVIKKVVKKSRPTTNELFRKNISPHIPDAAIDEIQEYFLSKNDLSFRISNSRKTKLGDFRYDYQTKLCAISVNKDLNPYAFLITLLHEMAHYECWKAHKRKVKPHGEEWKHFYRLLAIPFLREDIFPKEIIATFTDYLQNPSASTCGDIELMKKLKLHNENDNPNKVMLENIAPKQAFLISNKTMVKVEKKRKRYLCKDINSGKMYLVSSIAEVELVQSKTN